MFQPSNPLSQPLALGRKSSGNWACIISCLVALLFGLSRPAQAQTWMNSAWPYRSAVSITNPNGTILTNFQVKVTLDASFDFTHAQSDGADLRVTSSDGVTALPFWIADWRPGSTSATIWVQIQTIPSAGTVIWLYSGNPAAVSASSGRSTFSFFDDFEAAPTSSVGYFQFNPPQTVFVPNSGAQIPSPHTMSVVQANSGGFAYAVMWDRSAAEGLASREVPTYPVGRTPSA